MPSLGRVCGPRARENEGKERREETAEKRRGFHRTGGDAERRVLTPGSRAQEPGRRPQLTQEGVQGPLHPPLPGGRTRWDTGEISEAPFPDPSSLPAQSLVLFKVCRSWGVQFYMGVEDPKAGTVSISPFQALVSVKAPPLLTEVPGALR